MASGIMNPGVTPISEGGTGGNNWKEALQNLNAMPVHPLTSNNEDLDTMLETKCNARVRSTINTGLYNALGYTGNGFAQVIQFFYTGDPSSVTLESARVQIAFPYSTSSKFAWRNYNGGWSSWHTVG